VGSEPVGDVAAVPELVEDPPEDDAPAEEDEAETCDVEAGLLMLWALDS